MKSNTAFERRQLARVEKRRLVRAAKVKHLRRVTGAWKPGSRGPDPFTSTKAREATRNSEYYAIEKRKERREERRRKAAGA